MKRADGTLVWKQRPMTHVLTDPVIWQGDLCALIGGPCSLATNRTRGCRPGLAARTVAPAVSS